MVQLVERQSRCVGSADDKWTPRAISASRHNVDKTHFNLKKVIGAGDHSIVWLVERRPGKRTSQRFEDYYFNRLTEGLLEFLEKSKNAG